MTCSDCKAMEARMAQRGQALLDLVCEGLRAGLKADPSNATLLNVADRFLKNQGILDLRGEETPLKLLKDEFDFPPPSAGNPDIADAKAE